MGSRGPRSAADLSTPRSNLSDNALEPIDIPALAKQHGLPQREMLRAVKRAERRGEVVSQQTKDGPAWFWCGTSRLEKA
jgi:hypothetical protein